MCQLEKPRANEITAPPALTARKLELGGKAMVSQSRFRRTRFSCGQSWGKQTKTNEGASAAVRVQGGTCCGDEISWVSFVSSKF